MRLLLCTSLLWLAGTSTPAQILVTEIMFEPVRDRGSEYVEIFNAGSAVVSLRGMTITDATGRVQATVPSSARSIQPGGFAVIAASDLIYEQFPWLIDSSCVVVIGKSSLGLNASGDEVVVRSRSGVKLDSVVYSDDWHRPGLPDSRGTALERVSLTATSNDARSWSSAVARHGGTPGAFNSVALPPRTSSAELAVEPLVVSPDADGFQDFTRVSWKLPRGGFWIMLTLHDLGGRLVRRIVNNELSPTTGEIVWDGCDADRRALGPGLYVLRLEAYDDADGSLRSAQCGVVVAAAGRR